MSAAKNGAREVGDRCWSGKRTYRTNLDAMLDNQKRPVIARSYRCPLCRGWHITRQRQF